MTGKFYTFGMLRTLNSRAKLRRRMQSRSLGRTSLTGWTGDQAARKRLSIQAPSTMVRQISIMRLHGLVNPILTLYVDLKKNSLSTPQLIRGLVKSHLEKRRMSQYKSSATICILPVAYNQIPPSLMPRREGCLETESFHTTATAQSYFSNKLDT